MQPRCAIVNACHSSFRAFKSTLNARQSFYVSFTVQNLFAFNLKVACHYAQHKFSNFIYFFLVLIFEATTNSFFFVSLLYFIYLFKLDTISTIAFEEWDNYSGISWLSILRRMTSELHAGISSNSVDRGRSFAAVLKPFRVHGASVKPFTVASHEKRRLPSCVFFRMDRVLAYRSPEDTT